MKNKKLELAILEAIKIISQETDAQVSFKVEHVSDKPNPFSKDVINKTFISIEIKD